MNPTGAALLACLVLAILVLNLAEKLLEAREQRNEAREELAAHQCPPPPAVDPWADVMALSSEDSETRAVANQLLAEALSPEARHLHDQIGTSE